jgi:hypothetical protein
MRLLLALILIWALVVFRGFRIAVGLLVLVGIVWLMAASDQAQKQKAADEATAKVEEAKEKARQAELWSRVRPEQVELRNPQLSLENLSGDRFKLSGSIKNLSNQRLGAFEIDVTARDCADRCEIIGHTTDVMWVEVPPQQVRGITGVIILSDLPQLRGKFVPQFVVKRVYAGDLLDEWWHVTKN